MRRVLFVLTLWAFAGGAYAHQCPGATGWVFDDVEAEDPFCPAITWLAQRGITLGCEVIDGSHRWGESPPADFLADDRGSFEARVAAMEGRDGP